MTAAATLATAMLLNPDFWGTPVEVSTEQADRDLAAWQLARTVRQIINVAECPDGACIDDPSALWDECYALVPDLQDDKALLAQCRLVMIIAKTVERDRALATGARA